MIPVLRGGRHIAKGRRVPKHHDNLFRRTSESIIRSATSTVGGQLYDTKDSWTRNVRLHQIAISNNMTVPAPACREQVEKDENSKIPQLDFQHAVSNRLDTSTKPLHNHCRESSGFHPGSSTFWTTPDPLSNGMNSISSKKVQTEAWAMVRSTLSRPDASNTHLGSIPMETLGIHSHHILSLYYNMNDSSRHSFMTPSRVYFSTDTSSDSDPKESIKRFSTVAKVPTPTSAPKEPDSLIPTRADAQVMLVNLLKLTWSAVKAIVSFTIKTPYYSVYYLTHPKERMEKIAEIRAIVKKEFDHYWTGTKLLMADVRTARNLLKRTLSGSSLTRRERKQLLRTVSDLFRLVPFSMFILIPFMEFALPFALRLFPNMLPSTFQDSLKAEETMKRELKSRIAMAQFFQETMEELAKEQKRLAAKRKDREETGDGESAIATKQEESAESMLEFLARARSGEMMPPDVIIQYANYFQDDYTLDNMPRMQLVNLCKYMSIPPYGSDSFLRFQLRHRIRILKEDDQRILWEGIDSLTKMELREACQERGMRSTGLSKEAYKRALQQWLDLSVSKNVPISLLIMSRTFYLHEEMLETSSADESKSVTSLADAISGLDKDVLNEVILQVATSEEQKSNPDVRKIKLEVVTQQNEKIRQEQAERERAAAKMKEYAEKNDASVEKSAEEVVKDASPQIAASKTSVGEPKKASVVEGKAISSDTVEEKFFDDTAAPEAVKTEEEKRQDVDDDRNLSNDEMDAISQLLSSDPVSKERADLEKIKSAMTDGKDSDEANVPGQDRNDESIDRKVGGDPTVKIVADKQKDVTDHKYKVSVTIEKFEKEAAEEAAASTTFSTEVSTNVEASSEEADDDKANQQEPVDVVDPVVAQLRKRIQSMVDKIEVQLSDVQVKIGDKLHFLDKDNDGILSRDEMVECLQQVLKREINFEEATQIAREMDGNEDGVFTVQELINWIETNRLVKLEKEGRDADMDRIMESQSTESDTTESQSQADKSSSQKK